MIYTVTVHNSWPGAILQQERHFRETEMVKRLGVGTLPPGAPPVTGRARECRFAQMEGGKRSQVGVAAVFERSRQPPLKMGLCKPHTEPVTVKGWLQPNFTSIKLVTTEEHGTSEAFSTNNRAHRVTFLWATCSDGLSGQCPRMMSVTTAKFRVHRVRYIQVGPLSCLTKCR